MNAYNYNSYTLKKNSKKFHEMLNLANNNVGLTIQPFKKVQMSVKYIIIICIHTIQKTSNEKVL